MHKTYLAVRPPHPASFLKGFAKKIKIFEILT
jgi:hypothetical protein